MTAKADTNPLREALLRMEHACEQLAATRSIKIYEAMIDGGQTQALLELDNARREARTALASEPVAGTDDLRHALQRMADHDPADPAVSYDRLELLVASAAQAAKNALAALSAPPAPAGREAPLDLAWEAINALGGSAEQNNSYDQGLVDGIDKALEAIEKLGGEDPVPKRNGPALPPQALATTASAPGPLSWKISEDTAAQIAAIDDNIRMAPSRIVAMGATPPIPGAADRAAVIEECAKVVDAWAGSVAPGVGRIPTAAYRIACDIAKAIRAVAPANTGETGR